MDFGRKIWGLLNSIVAKGDQLSCASIYNNIRKSVHLDNGDLKYSIDFRQVYATILDKWLKVDSEDVLKKKFENLQFI